MHEVCSKSGFINIIAKTAPNENKNPASNKYNGCHKTITTTAIDREVNKS